MRFIFAVVLLALPVISQAASQKCNDAIDKVSSTRSDATTKWDAAHVALKAATDANQLGDINVIMELSNLGEPSSQAMNAAAAAVEAAKQACK